MPENNVRERSDRGGKFELVGALSRLFHEASDARFFLSLSANGGYCR